MLKCSCWKHAPEDANTHFEVWLLNICNVFCIAGPTTVRNQRYLCWLWQITLIFKIGPFSDLQDEGTCHPANEHLLRYMLKVIKAVLRAEDRYRRGKVFLEVSLSILKTERLAVSTTMDKIVEIQWFSAAGSGCCRPSSEATGHQMEQQTPITKCIQN